MRKIEFTNYSIADLVANESFQRFCLGNDAASVEFWNTWIKLNTDRAEDIEKAKAIYYLLNGNNTDMQFERHSKHFSAKVATYLSEHHDTEGKYSGINGKIKPMFSKWALTGVAVCALIALCLLKVFMSGPQEIYTKTYIAKAGEIKSIKLADGSKIVLNALSRLSVPVDFNQKNRTVELIGEAFFEVAHDKKKAFVIRTAEINTVVLGTSFNVKAYPDDRNVTVAIRSGRVGVYVEKKEKSTVYLLPNQDVVYNRDSGVLTRHDGIDLNLHLSWTKNRLVFKNTPLAEVVKILERKYNVSINYDKGMEACTVYYDFGSEPVAVALSDLSNLLDVKLTKKGGSYQLSGSPCFPLK